MILIQVKVKPQARVSSFTQLEDGTWLAQIKALPIDGKANQELIGLVATHFHVRKSQVAIKSGSSGRQKWLQIDVPEGTLKEIK